MRHQNFTVDFGPNVTFISGKNGSGKSATLQALQCCLGVRARKMGRGTSLGGFVRRESDQVHEDRALGGRNAFDRPKVLQSGPKSSLVFVRWHSPEAEQPVVLRWARRKTFDLKNPARDSRRTNA